jgi:predicted acyltransferase (DUF342 family)
MAIPNITRNNTVDEWRIQTNQSANTLNTLETGTYTKTTGTLAIGANASLQVSNTALFSTDITVGRDITLGVQETATGNLGVGGVVSIYGPGTALFVANNVVSNGTVIVRNTIIANNITANSNVVVIGTANVGFLAVANTGVFGQSVSVGNNLTVTANTSVGGNVSVTQSLSVGGNFSVTGSANVVGNLGITGSLATATSLNVGTNSTVTGNVSIGGTLQANGAVSLADDLLVGGDTTILGNLGVTGNFTLAGQTIIDTDTFIVGATTPITSGNAYFGVYRGNTQSTLGTVNANAYIRWAGSSKEWQLRDVDNTDLATSFSKVLTANLITISAATVSNSTFMSSWLTKNYVDTANTNLKSYTDNLVTTANTNLKSYTDNLVTTANTNLKSYTDNLVTTANTYNNSTYVKLSPGSPQTIAQDLTLSGNVIISSNLTINGTVTTVNTQELNIADNEIVLNSDVSNGTAPTQDAGFVVNRGSSTNTYIRWNETVDSWVANNGITSGEFRLANNTTYLTEGTNLYLTSARVRANVSNSTPILYDSSTGVFSHAASGVAATTYGSSINVPVFAVNSTGHVTGVTDTAIRTASTSQTGIVQLTDSTSSTSTTTAATPNALNTLRTTLATSGQNGIMSSTFAAKLDGIAASATNVTNTNQLTNGAAFITASSTTTGTHSGLVTGAVRRISSVIGSNTTAVAGTTYILTASLTLTLPSSPTAGDTVGVVNASGTATPVIARNGQNIMSLAEDMTINNINASLSLTYADATRGWVIAL